MLKKFREWVMKSVLGAINTKATAKAIADMVVQAEGDYPAEGSGPSKRLAVIDALAGRLDIPRVSEATERWLIGFLVDIIVAVFNAWVWKRASGR